MPDFANGKEHSTTLTHTTTLRLSTGKKDNGIGPLHYCRNIFRRDSSVSCEEGAARFLGWMLLTVSEAAGMPSKSFEFC